MHLWLMKGNILFGGNQMAESEEFEKPRFDGCRFANPTSFVGWTGVPGIIDCFKWKFIEDDFSRIPSDEVLNETLPICTPNFHKASQLSLTWLGHATVVVRMSGVTFITDPVWAKKASPISVMPGYRRYRPPPAAYEDLPELDFGLISHCHYDHLDATSVRTLCSMFPRMLWFVPLGLGRWMIKDGVPAGNVHEMNWGDHRTFDFNGTSCEIWCVPAQHWSQRTLFDRYKTLWCSWAVVGESRRFYFTGDTGYCEREFDKLGQKLGPFDLAAISIGCYAPVWFMKSQHISPAEAVKIHRKIAAKKSIGIHWGTYEMGGNESYLDPPRLLKEEVLKAGLNAADFTAIAHGETWTEEDSSSSETDTISDLKSS
uniref:Metallo-beta-lactamase domain-containing protein n=1 Tax=Parascaris univalens TaxID=6257 RepID=A0A915B3M3_PARUN